LFKIGGNTEQTQYRGKNLYSGGNQEFIGTKTINIEPIPAGAYIISGNFLSADTDSTICLIAFYKDNVQVGFRNVSRGNVSTDLTLTDEANKLIMYASNGAVPSEGDTAIFSNIMIRNNNIIDSTYEPYCGGKSSPSENFPQLIKNVKGNIVNKVSNKNLVNINEVTSITSSVIELGEYNNFTEGQEITFSGKLDLGNTVKAARARLQIKYNDGTSDRYIGEWVSGTGIKESFGTFTVTSNVSQILLQFQTNDADVRLFDIQLENGLVVTDYIPHLEQIAEFTLQENQYLALNDTLEDNGIHHKRGHYKIKSSDITFTFELTNGNKATALTLPNKKQGQTNNLLCNKLVFNRTFAEGTFYENPGNIAIVGNENDTVATFREKYTDSIIEYDLEEEEIESYTNLQQEQYNAIKNLKTYKDLTIIVGTSEELDPVLNLIAFKEVPQMRKFI
jgi:hypothetical protein